MPTDFSVKPTLVGERVVLRPFTPADIDALSAANVLQNMGSAAMAQGDRHRAEEHYTAALRGFRAASETRGIANVLHGLGTQVVHALPRSAIRGPPDRQERACRFHDDRGAPP